MKYDPALHIRPWGGHSALCCHKQYQQQLKDGTHLPRPIYKTFAESLIYVWEGLCHGVCYNFKAQVNGKFLGKSVKNSFLRTVSPGMKMRPDCFSGNRVPHSKCQALPQARFWIIKVTKSSLVLILLSSGYKILYFSEFFHKTEFYNSKMSKFIFSNLKHMDRNTSQICETFMSLLKQSTVL